jgi:hypothetical protein
MTTMTASTLIASDGCANSVDHYSESNSRTRAASMVSVVI